MQTTKLVDASQQNRVLHEWIVFNYGTRCPSYERGCVVCEAWDYYEALKLKGFPECVVNFPDTDKKLETFKKRQVDILLDKIKDYPEAIKYLKLLVN